VGERDGVLINWPVPADEELTRQAQRFAPEAPIGAWVPWQHRAQQWVASALSIIERGRLVVVDYADATANMATRAPWEWVRTYRGHMRGDDPLTDLGLQDVTCEVAVDQLDAVRPITADRSQADFLRAHGIDELVTAARSQWEAAAAAPTVDALKARSRVSEAAALTDPTGLGAFRVLEWATPPATRHPFS
jgi:SAM-dependent MidA family methyltransferase